jgi:hypothetical protein
VEDIEVRAILDRHIEGLVTGAAPESTVKAPGSLLHACVVTVVEFVDDRDADCFAGSNEPDIRIRHIALKRDL